MRPLHITKLLSSFVLFFSFVFVSFFLTSSDKEYNLNQQIDRGYISRNAIFFVIDNPSYRTPVFYEMTPEEYNLSTEESNSFDLSPVAAEDPDYVMLNPVGEDGLTRIESLLSSGSYSYFSAIHTGMGRGVFYQGNVSLPPMLEGRFFLQEECLSREPLAVIGSSYCDAVYIDDGIKHIDYLNKPYRVIGVTGVNHSSTLDSLIFVNLGSLSPEEQLNGRYYIDAEEKIDGVFEQMNEASVRLFNNSLVRIEIPVTLIDVVSGGVYLKDYLKICVALLFVFMYFSILTQAILQQKRMVSVMKIVGITFPKVFFKAYFPLLMSGIMGILLSALIGYVLMKSRYFALPEYTVLQIFLTFSALGLLLLALWTSIICLFGHRICIREVTHRL